MRLLPESAQCYRPMSIRGEPWDEGRPGREFDIDGFGHGLRPGN